MDDPTVREKLRAYITRDLIRDAAYPLTDAEGVITGFKPKTKSAPELEYLAANKEAVVAELIKP